ncbi:uncharacterized protein V1513DRAFT_481677 [Lipomyces chichibuensis]|uniref:uncharacterized protein n=1 Tax=Lipomyces chichibuensis TaxID=1546026 RepID=UPI00334374F9
MRSGQNPTISAGSPLTGRASLTLDDPTSSEDISVRFKGMSFTARIVTTFRRHTASLSDIRMRTLSPGEHILLFTIQVPVYSERTSSSVSQMDVPTISSGCWLSAHLSATYTSCYRSRYVDYRLVVDFSMEVVSRTDTLIPATLVHSSALLYYRDSRNLVEHTYVDVPIEAERILYDNSIGEHRPFEVCISDQVDDISRIVGIVNIKLRSIKVPLRSDSADYAQKHSNRSLDEIILFEQNKLDTPLTAGKKRRTPRFRIDDKIFKTIELGNNIICAAIGLSFNEGGTRAVEISHAIIINSRIDYNLDPIMLLPACYQMADYKYEYENDSFQTDKEADFLY